MASITLQRDVKANLNSINKVDGQILFTTDKNENNNIYTDVPRENGSLERIQIGGLLPSQEKTVTDGVKKAAQSETNAANSAKLSESWAKGGTGSRSGEDTNNSKYYSNQSSSSATNSKSWAIGTTHSRDGEDTNNSKYYSQQSKTYDTESKSYAVGGTNTRAGENTDNSKYYSEQSAKSSKTSESWAIGGTGTRNGENTNNSKYYATQSSNSSQSAKNSATLSESWAIGGTGKREGEDTNNAKHYAEQAKASADSAAQGMKPATPTSVGAVKPDNVTTILDSSNSIVAQELQSVTQAQFDAMTTKSNKIAYLIQSKNDTTSGTIYYNGRYYGAGDKYLTKTDASNIYVPRIDGTSNSPTYVVTNEKDMNFCLATIVIGGSYCNYPIQFEVAQRGRDITTLSIIFRSVNNNDPYIQSFTSDGYDKFYLAKTATSTWKLYVVASESWTAISIKSIFNTIDRTNTTISTNITPVSAIPSGAIQAVNPFLTKKITQITQADYNALPSATQSANVYLITD